MAGGCHSASVDPLALRAVPSGLPELLPSGAVKKWPAPGGTAGEAYFITAYSPNYASDGLILRASKFARGLLRSDSRGEHWRKVELPSLVVLDGGVPQQVVHSIVFSPSFASETKQPFCWNGWHGRKTSHRHEGCRNIICCRRIHRIQSGLTYARSRFTWFGCPSRHGR